MQDTQDMIFMETKDGMIVGTQEQCNAYMNRMQTKRNTRNDHCSKATIVKQATPKAIAKDMEKSNQGTRLMNYKNIRFAIDEKKYTHYKTLNQLFIASKDEEHTKLAKEQQSEKEGVMGKRSFLIEEAHTYCRELAKFCKAHGVDKTDEIERISITSLPKLYTAITNDTQKTYKDVQECIEMFQFHMIILELLGETHGEIKAEKITIQLLETYKMKQFGQFVCK